MALAAHYALDVAPQELGLLVQDPPSLPVAQADLDQGVEHGQCTQGGEQGSVHQLHAGTAVFLGLLMIYSNGLLC